MIGSNWLLTEDSCLSKTYRFIFLLLTSVNSRCFRHFWQACDLRRLLLATRHCKNLEIPWKLWQVCKKFISSAALQYLKSTFSSFPTNLTIVLLYWLRITCNNDNLVTTLKRTKNIKINVSVPNIIFLSQLIIDWFKIHSIINVKLTIRTYSNFQNFKPMLHIMASCIVLK